MTHRRRRRTGSATGKAGFYRLELGDRIDLLRGRLPPSAGLRIVLRGYFRSALQVFRRSQCESGDCAVALIVAHTRLGQRLGRRAGSGALEFHRGDVSRRHVVSSLHYRNVGYLSLPAAKIIGLSRRDPCRLNRVIVNGRDSPGVLADVDQIPAGCAAEKHCRQIERVDPDRLNRGQRKISCAFTHWCVRPLGSPSND